MEALFVKLVNMSITAGWLVLAILAVRLVFRRAPKWMLCLLWGMVALRLLCPFSMESGLSLIPSTQPLKQEIVFTAPPERQASGEILNSMGSVVLEKSPAAPARGEILDAGGNVVLEKDLNPYSADPEQVWLFALSRVWGLGMGLMVLYAFISYLLLRRRVATAIPMGKNIKRSEFVDTPFVLGLFRPVIYIPACMEPGDIPYVVAHEQAHIRRRDHWWKPLGFLLLSIYWFNPLLWVAYILLCRDIEAACDEKVIRDMPVEERRAYSMALLHCSIHRRRIAACPLAFGEVGVKERVKSVMNYKKPAFWVLLAAAIISVVVAVCFLTNPISPELPVTEEPRVFTWFDRYSANPEEQYPKETVMELPGMAGASVAYDESRDEIRLATAEGTQPVISSPFMMENIFLTDLTGDGIWEICATIRTEETMQVQVYDAAEKRLYTLPTPENGIYVLTEKADRLCVLEKDENWSQVGYGQLRLLGGVLQVGEVDPEVRALTEQVVCVDIWTNKQVCLSSGEKREVILDLLHALQDGVEPASRQEVDAARKDTFHISQITVQYALGQRNLIFSQDFSIIWEENADLGYRVFNPQPIRDFVTSVTDGVRGKTAVGEPFATMDAPWDWCAGIHSKAVESAQAHVCLYAYSHGNTSGSSSTGGTISYDTLEELLAILNRLPKGAFTPEKVVKGRSYRSILNNQGAQNTSVGIVDGVNNLGVILNYRDGKVSLLLTDEMEKVRGKDESYLNPTQQWLVQDSALLDFMEKITEDPPVITYFVGSEYEWQDPQEISMGAYTVSLRLIEGWEVERVENPTDFGIRCRPADVTEGWLYFSFWPEGYHPQEENRLILEGGFWEWTTVTSYSDEAGTPNNFDVTDAVWSYERIELGSGDYVVINDGADSWFREYRDQIDDTMLLTQISVADT